MRLLQLLQHVNETAVSNLAEGSIHSVYQTMEQHPTRQDEYFRDMEEAWTGGVGDLGNPEAAYAIQRHPEYYDYHDGLQQAVEANLGDPFTAYRLLPQEQLEAWSHGADLPPMGVSVSRRHAEAFRRFAINRNRTDLVLVTFPVPSEAVIMLGHEGEQELVIDPNWTSFHEVQVLSGLNEEIGPHSEKELAFMLAGKKPLAMVVLNLLPKEEAEKWRAAVKAGKLVHKKGHNLTTKYKTDFFALPGEEWRIDKILELYSDIRNRGIAPRNTRDRRMSAKDHIAIGQLLGYSDEDIQHFLDHIGLREAIDPRALVNVDTPQFRNWFKNSKAVDDEGHPIVFFRGTAKVPGSEKFATRRSIPSFVASADIASIYSASYPETTFGVPFGQEPPPPAFRPGATVTPVFLSIQNPVDMRGMEMVDFEMGLFGLLKSDWANYQEFEMMLRLLRQLSRLESKGIQFEYELPEGLPGEISRADWNDVIQWLYDEWENADEEEWNGSSAEELTAVLGEIQVDAYAIVDTSIFREWAESKGFDGVVHDDIFQQGAKYSQALLGKDVPNGLDEESMHITWRPFYPQQVKSIFNQGGWSGSAMNEAAVDDIQLDYNQDVEKENRGFVVDQIDAYKDGRRVGYLKMAYVPKELFHMFFPSVLHFESIMNGKHYIPYEIVRSGPPYEHWSKYDEETQRQILATILVSHAWSKQSIAKTLPIEQVRALIRKYERDMAESRRTGSYRDFYAHFVDKPFVDYIKVDSGDAFDAKAFGREENTEGEDLQGQGIGSLLYRAGAKWMKSRGMKLHASGTQSAAAQRAWKKMASQGNVGKTPYGRRYYKVETR